MRPHLALASLALAAAAAFPPAARALTTFRVSVPANTPAGSTVYIAGSFQGWNPGHPSYALAPQPDGRWAITLSLPSGTPIQFKFTRGTWGMVEKGANGEEIANRQLTPSGDQAFDFTVASWADVGTVTGRLDTLTHGPFLSGRRCWVWLPPGYESSSARYPVLYMHDGQNLFDASRSFAGEWHIDETCTALIAAGEIEPLIVVGIENSADRCWEYTPWAGGPCTGGGGDAYLQAIRDHLIPEVDRRYRTRTGPDHTMMAGSSLGGLITHYAGHTYPETWGRIAAFSSSLWWNAGAMVPYAAGRPKPPLARYYQDMGTIEAGGTTDGDGDGTDDYIELLRLMRDVALAQGFADGADFLSVEGAGHTHNEYWWSQRAPGALRFLVDPPGVNSVGPPALPALAELRPPAPNPTAGATRVEFVLARAARARVRVIDAAGREVTRLADREFATGRHELSWDGRGADGARARPGLYWLRVEGAGAPQGRKLVLLR